MAYPNTPVPNSIEEEATDFKVTTKRALDGTAHKRYHGGGELRKWRLTYQYLDATDQAILDTYYRTNKGEYTTDTWTHPWDASIANVKVSIAAYRRERGAGATRNITVTLQEEV